MENQTIIGKEAKDLIQAQITQHSEGLRNALSNFNATSALMTLLEAIRSIEEIINLPKFEIKDEKIIKEFLELRLEAFIPPKIENLYKALSEQFEAGTASRFANLVIMLPAIGLSFRMHGMCCGEEFRTLGSAITYLQSRRRQIVALLYCIPQECRGNNTIEPLDALNIFLPIVEYSCVNLTSLHQNLVLFKIYNDYKLTMCQNSFSGNYSLDTLSISSLEPERVGITEIPFENIESGALNYRMELKPDRVFSVPELCNDLLLIDSQYSEFKLGETEFGTMSCFIVACSREARDEYHIEIGEKKLEQLMNFFRLSKAARRHLIYTGKDYSDAINAYSPFIQVGQKYFTTVTLLSRFAYHWKNICLNKIKRFQIRSGFIFEKQVKNELEKQGFMITDITRIERQEFDVVAIKNDIIYNVQCKNNFVDLTRISTSPNLFARYNKHLDRYYATALLKEEGREELLKKTLHLNKIKHVILSKFPIATKNPRILPFREIENFSKKFSDHA